MDRLQLAINTLANVKLEVAEAPKVIGVMNLLKQIMEETNEKENKAEKEN